MKNLLVCQIQNLYTSYTTYGSSQTQKSYDLVYPDQMMWSTYQSTNHQELVVLFSHNTSVLSQYFSLNHRVFPYISVI